jgi:signal transduction histidine kinase
MLKKNAIYLVVVLIGILLVTNVILTNYNNSIIRRNKALQQQIEQIKNYYDQIGKTVIHSEDIGLRGFAIVRNEKFVTPLDSGVAWEDSIVNKVEIPLIEINYDLSEFKVFRDSLHSYAQYCLMLKQLLVEERDEEFKKIFSVDKGAHLYWQYLELEKHIEDFLDQIDAQAELEYQAALKHNQILQAILFLICVPTLLYTAFNTTKNLGLLELLRKGEAERNRILNEQNMVLEQKVEQRTQEIRIKNEEMISQSEELSAQRDELSVQNKKYQEAQQIIEKQNSEIQLKNARLEQEVASRTQELQNTNNELIQQNNQLEQFAFIAAHNLRAPLARILGLANVLQITPSATDRDSLVDKLVSSSRDMDEVVKDLNTILEVKKQTGNYSEVNLTYALDRALKLLEKVKEDKNVKIEFDFKEANVINAIGPYVESILYNLISNAIKYRDPVRDPVIHLKTFVETDFICLMVSDNGLGIDLAQYKQNVFGLYKRFHLHVEGKGLGLYLVKTQIIAMGGKIEVQSELFKGTTFFVYFKR